jgi:hypothetical protein
MFRKFLTPLLAVAFLTAPAFVPVIMKGLSASALAAVTVNNSRSNTYRTGKDCKTQKPPCK